MNTYTKSKPCFQRNASCSSWDAGELIDCKRCHQTCLKPSHHIAEPLSCSGIQMEAEWEDWSKNCPNDKYKYKGMDMPVEYA